MNADWPRCRRLYIEAALANSHGTHSIADIESGIAAGDFQFWPGANSAAITELNRFPRLTAFTFFLVGGDLEELTRTIEPCAVAWARTQGATKVIQFGRRGWLPILAPLGYRPLFAGFSKDI
jgi:hypothetical protein